MKTFDGFNYGDLIVALAMACLHSGGDTQLSETLSLCTWDPDEWSKQDFDEHIEAIQWEKLYGWLAVCRNNSSDTAGNSIHSGRQGPQWLLENLDFDRPSHRGLEKAKDFLVGYVTA